MQFPRNSGQHEKSFELFRHHQYSFVRPLVVSRRMAKQRSRKRKTALVGAGNKRSVAPLSHTRRLERPDLLILLVLALVTPGIYAQLVGHQYITLDDPTYIQENPMVNHGVTAVGLAWAFTTFHAKLASAHLDCTHDRLPALWHDRRPPPVREYADSRSKHVTCLLVSVRTKHARWPSALIAALFALHPLHVESVAWASKRKDTLSTFFGLLSLIAYVRYAAAPSISG